MISSMRLVLRGEVCRRQCLRYIAADRPSKKPIISCKRSQFNHYKGQSYSKFDGIPLASQGWLHDKSKNDYFTIHLNANKTLEEPTVTKTFQDVGISPEIEEVMARKGFTSPTLIQMKAFRSIFEGNNTMITAETGCGKTFAYLLPIIQNIIQWKNHINLEEYNSPLAVIISPSRELTKQIGQVASDLAKYFLINVTTLVGGHTKRLMINRPVEECDILVTTLGAFSKLVTTGIYKTNNVHHVVLDEADTLLDDSFSDKLSHVLKKFPIQYHTPPTIPPSGCQLTLASATMPVELPDTISIFANTESLKRVTTPNVHRVMAHVPQKFIRLGKAQKPLELLKLVRADLNMKKPVMIFSNKSDTSDWVSMFLNESNIRCISISGRMPVDMQIGIYDEFKSGEVDVISCTDIASRGLDTMRVKHIINYDFPLYTADYIHRCGRTGRLGSANDCSVTNLVAWPREIALVQRIEMSVRKDDDLPSVNANIRRLITDRINNFITRDIRMMQKG